MDVRTWKVKMREASREHWRERIWQGKSQEGGHPTRGHAKGRTRGVNEAVGHENGEDTEEIEEMGENGRTQKEKPQKKLLR